MTTVDSRPIPNYYVREETTAGPLYFYPMPAVRQSHNPLWPHHDVTWWHDDGTQAEVRGDYVITTSPAEHLTAMWPEHPKVDHYELKPLDEMTDIGRTLATNPGAFPEVLTPEGRREKCECEDEGTCTWCQVRDDMYRRVMTEPTTGQREYNVSHLEQLDAYQPDPAPDREWRLASPSLAAFYPRPAHHQFPGEMSVTVAEVAYAVREALAGIGADVESFHEWEHSRTVSVTVNIAWDQELPWTPVKGKGQKAREMTYSRRLAAKRLTTWHREVKVPMFVTGESKADALANWTARLNEMVNEMVPPHTVACEKCKGLGYVR